MEILFNSYFSKSFIKSKYETIGSIFFHLLHWLQSKYETLGSVFLNVFPLSYCFIYLNNLVNYNNKFSDVKIVLHFGDKLALVNIYITM